MGGAHATWRLVRQVVLLMIVAAMGVVAVAPAVASSSSPDPFATGTASTYRVALSPDPAPISGPEEVFVATVEASVDGGASWKPAVGELVTFAYVTDGAGSVVAVNGGPIGSMSCATDAAGHCTIAVRTDAPGEAVVAASARGLSASVLLP